MNEDAMHQMHREQLHRVRRNKQRATFHAAAAISMKLLDPAFASLSLSLSLYLTRNSIADGNKIATTAPIHFEASKRSDALLLSC